MARSSTEGSTISGPGDDLGNMLLTNKETPTDGRGANTPRPGDLLNDQREQHRQRRRAPCR